MTIYVAGFLFRNQGKEVALIKKRKPFWQYGLLNGVGGKVAAGETPAQAMAREFEEEAGIVVLDWRQFAELSGPASYDTENWRVHFFVADCERGTAINSRTAEVVNWYWVGHLISYPTVGNLRWLIPMARGGVDGKIIEVK
ncbi:MAG TPA: NUDIX hydrolase [Verrucomicrobiae bacterium]|nr:NUDIX hydrolase [Verrucomicrobiae bacterium]